MESRHGNPRDLGKFRARHKPVLVRVSSVGVTLVVPVVRPLKVFGSVVCRVFVDVINHVAPLWAWREEGFSYKDVNLPQLLFAIAAESYQLVAILVICLILDVAFAAVFAESPGKASAHDHPINRAHPPMIADLVVALVSDDRAPLF
jgi:hypothetical protein